MANKIYPIIGIDLKGFSNSIDTDEMMFKRTELKLAEERALNAVFSDNTPPFHHLEGGDGYMAVIDSQNHVAIVQFVKKLGEQLELINRQLNKPVQARAVLHLGACRQTKSFDDRTTYIGDGINQTARYLDCAPLREFLNRNIESVSFIFGMSEDFYNSVKENPEFTEEKARFSPPYATRFKAHDPEFQIRLYRAEDDWELPPKEAITETITTPSVLERSNTRDKVCNYLRNDYIALFAQRDSELEGFVGALVRDESSPTGMQFIPVKLYWAFTKIDDFEVSFMENLKEASRRVSSDAYQKVEQALQEFSKYTFEFRLRKAIDALARAATAKHLVIILQAFEKITEDQLRKILAMLRDYHVDRNTPGTPGAKLRFLVAGEAALWNLCAHNTYDRSPFNIARRIWLEGLSAADIRRHDRSIQEERAREIVELTDGIPSLTEMALAENSPDLTRYFEQLAKCWSVLIVDAQALLIDLLKGNQNFPTNCEIDYECPQIPMLESPWREAFWAGFLKLNGKELTWRSKIHRAFVEEKARARAKS